MSRTINWAQYMYRAMDSRGPELVPGYKEQPYLSFFFLFFVIFGAFFITNLFVGVVISAYNRESERLGKNFLLTDKQKKWVETKILVLKMKPKIAFLRPLSNKLRQKCYDLAEHKYFEVFILVNILINTVVLTIKWPNMSKQTELITERINFYFTAVFTVELIVKLFAYHCRYFIDNWNIFDFLIVVTSLSFVIV